MKDISIGLNITKQQLTSVIGSLEADGYVTKAPNHKVFIATSAFRQFLLP
ncbi:MarR family transcriptional regulator [Bacillus glycinifermentans]|mgnify:FL=1|uniref:Helix-turn-helix domain-containing protein n=1 Tax=Bacillus glycinifermentans TaxID=1664069 RepID=A0ABU6H1L5_9BACI|nr:helix-turn-helix domain-containing protein [Bacillus glycinifermentans]MEC0484519.1 helix-turn-helix domain-containing protein [Bacillus glycinifermentans]MEC0496910.1 helix-turn-helix domain-containing protein [Bacillus glycinifermentans]MEC0539585.1 helix-turn-helix domain-containing protein [Bacillus glycinifermentans]MEC3608512.1 helix-turn-helix domain-containing protein [Bacillus glycinifermentans]UOY87679.1 MarR family transcriptional regulator [Bacillus glycinifermentans]